MKKILISGGHLTPALALIDYLAKKEPEIKIIFAGRVYAQVNNRQPAHEYQLIKQRDNALFEPFNSGKWGNGHLLYRLQQIGLFFISLPHALSLMWHHKPKLFISFGGYLAVPLSLVAKLLGIPIITHEQTHTAGLANQLIAHLANRVAISYLETRKFFPPQKTVLTGNLIREKIMTQAKPPRWFRLKQTQPILYITGGSQGSEIINGTSGQIIQPLLKDWIVIHQCGSKSKMRNYHHELTQIKQQLNPKMASHYLIREWLNETELAWVYQQAQLVVGRAGANTVAEISLYQIPSILIPLKISRGDEQTKNAQQLAQIGASFIIDQTDLSPQLLLEKIRFAQANLIQMRAAFKKLPPLNDGLKAFVQLINVFLSPHVTKK